MTRYYILNRNKKRCLHILQILDQIHVYPLCSLCQPCFLLHNFLFLCCSNVFFFRLSCHIFFCQSHIHPSPVIVPVVDSITATCVHLTIMVDEHFIFDLCCSNQEYPSMYTGDYQNIKNKVDSSILIKCRGSTWTVKVQKNSTG